MEKGEILKRLDEYYINMNQGFYYSNIIDRLNLLENIFNKKGKEVSELLTELLKRAIKLKYNRKFFTELSGIRKLRDKDIDYIVKNNRGNNKVPKELLLKIRELHDNKGSILSKIFPLTNDGKSIVVSDPYNTSMPFLENKSVTTRVTAIMDENPLESTRDSLTSGLVRKYFSIPLDDIIIYSEDKTDTLYRRYLYYRTSRVIYNICLEKEARVWRRGHFKNP